jgi:hypothetical protein
MKRNIIITAISAAFVLAVPQAQSQIVPPGGDPFVNPGVPTAKPAPNRHGNAENGKVSAPNSGGDRDAVEHPAPEEAVPVMSFTYEAFSLPIKEAGELQRKGLDDAALYDIVCSGKQERLISVTTKSGQRCLVDLVSEYMYPTTYSVSEPAPDDAPLGEGAAVQKPKEKRKSGVLVPDDFETKNVGDSLELEAMYSPEARSIELNISVSHVYHTGDNNWAVGNENGLAKTPTFDSRKINTVITIPANGRRFIGTLNPVFANGISGKDANKQDIWFCFIGSSITRDDVARPVPKIQKLQASPRPETPGKSGGPQDH